MKTLIIYDSVYTNTGKVAHAIGNAFIEPDTATIVGISEAKHADLARYDLVIFGSPTHGGMPTKTMQTFLNAIPANGLKSVSVAAFDTRMDEHEQRFGLRMLMKIIKYAAPRIATTVRKKGGVLASEPEGFIVTGKEGPLREGELVRATAWAQTLMRK
jgi:flavodoxin